MLGQALADFPEGYSIVAKMNNKRLARPKRMLLSAAIRGRSLERR